MGGPNIEARMDPITLRHYRPSKHSFLSDPSNEPYQSHLVPTRSKIYCKIQRH